MSKTQKTIRYFIARILDRMHCTCWANVGLWAEGLIPFEDIFDKNCTEGNYYCGKCDKSMNKKDTL